MRPRGQIRGACARRGVRARFLRTSKTPGSIYRQRERRPQPPEQRHAGCAQYASRKGLLRVPHFPNQRICRRAYAQMTLLPRAGCVTLPRLAQSTRVQPSLPRTSPLHPITMRRCRHRAIRIRFHALVMNAARQIRLMRDISDTDAVEPFEFDSRLRRCASNNPTVPRVTRHTTDRYSPTGRSQVGLITERTRAESFAEVFGLN